MQLSEKLNVDEYGGYEGDQVEQTRMLYGLPTSPKVAIGYGVVVHPLTDIKSIPDRSIL